MSRQTLSIPLSSNNHFLFRDKVTGNDGMDGSSMICIIMTKVKENIVCYMFHINTNLILEKGRIYSKKIYPFLNSWRINKI